MSDGLYVRKSWLVHNERGIVAKGIEASLRENVILDHRRAGIVIDGSYYSEIFNNVVVNNGATGIFVNTSNEPQFGGIPPGADIVESIWSARAPARALDAGGASLPSAPPQLALRHRER